MKKKILLTSLMLILVPALMFVPMYAVMIYTANTGLEDYSDDVLGQWDAFQYYYENERFVCGDGNNMCITITEENICIDGTVLSPVDTTYSWISGTALSYEADGQSVTLFLSFDTRNNLKINVGDSSYIILLRKNAG